MGSGGFLVLCLPYLFHIGARFLGMGDIGFGRSVCRRNDLLCGCGWR